MPKPILDEEYEVERKKQQKVVKGAIELYERILLGTLSEGPDQNVKVYAYFGYTPEGQDGFFADIKYAFNADSLAPLSGCENRPPKLQGLLKKIRLSQGLVEALDLSKEFLGSQTSDQCDRVAVLKEKLKEFYKQGARFKPVDDGKSIQKIRKENRMKRARFQIEEPDGEAVEEKRAKKLKSASEDSRAPAKIHEEDVLQPRCGDEDLDGERPDGKLPKRTSILEERNNVAKKLDDGNLLLQWREEFLNMENPQVRELVRKALSVRWKVEVSEKALLFIHESRKLSGCENDPFKTPIFMLYEMVGEDVPLMASRVIKELLSNLWSGAKKSSIESENEIHDPVVTDPAMGDGLGGDSARTVDQHHTANQNSVALEPHQTNDGLPMIKVEPQGPEEVVAEILKDKETAGNPSLARNTSAPPPSSASIPLQRSDAIYPRAWTPNPINTTDRSTKQLGPNRNGSRYGEKSCTPQ